MRSGFCKSVSGLTVQCVVGFIRDEVFIVTYERGEYYAPLSAVMDWRENPDLDFDWDDVLDFVFEYRMLEQRLEAK